MAEANIPENEKDRLRALYSYDLLDRDLDVLFDNTIKIAADICDCDISVIALIDRDRQYFLARKGMKPRETPRAIAFCAHAILAPDTIFEIYDATSDPRFLDNPLVTGEIGVRFYAAQPLVTKEGFALGGLCLIDSKPKSLNDLQRDTLRNLGNIIMTLFEARKSSLAAADQLRKAHDELEARVEQRTSELQEESREREALEEQFRQVQKMEAIGHLTGGIAHDFNNLLAVILGNADILNEGLGGDDPQANAVVRAALRGAELTQRLLVFSRRQSLRPQAVDLDSLVADMSDLLARSLGETVEIETTTTAGLWKALADPGQVENTLLNLALNARDAMPEGGRLTIATANVELDGNYVTYHPDADPGAYVLLKVSDSGTGMPQEVRERAFEPFFTTKEVNKGTGLGLSMAYGFARQSGGHVTIDSEMGKGTTVSLYLPRAEADRPRVAGRAASEEPRGRGETVLIVEDDQDVRVLAVSILEPLGYNVLEATDGATALRILKGRPKIDLVLSDVVLPGGMNGLDVAKRAEALIPAVKVLLMSGYADSGAQRSGKLNDCGDLLNKPFRKHDLAQKVRVALDT